MTTGRVKYIDIARGIAMLCVVLAWCGKNSINILTIHCLEVRFYNYNNGVKNFQKRVKRHKPALYSRI